MSTQSGGAGGSSGGVTGGSGGVTGGSGGVTGGSSGVTGGTGNCPTNADVISDFEENSGVMKNQGTPLRKGWWYDYAMTTSGLTPPPAASTCTSQMTCALPAEALPAADASACNKYALHIKGNSIGDYGGFGAAFLPSPGTEVKSAYDVSGYTGISFRIKAGSGTPAAIFFEMGTKETQPTTGGGSLPVDAANQKVGLYNGRGMMLVPPYIPSAISSTWQTVYVPFGDLIPRWVPAAATCTAATPKCQAPTFIPTNVLAFQFSAYNPAMDKGFPTPSGSSVGTFDLWVDDVTLVKGDMGLPTRTGFPISGAGTLSNCTKPAGADAKYLVTAYDLWKSNFAKNGKVVRPENGNDTVSEGIAYGMLIAVNMNDKALFDQLSGSWGSGLMTWCQPAGAGSCSASGGSATDADEDAAFALLQAAKVWGDASYKTKAMSIISQIWSQDIDTSTHLPKGGSNYASSNPTNASYFAPAYYRAFKAAGDSNDWDSVVNAVYTAINGPLAGSNGLFPAWCNGTCTVSASNTDGATDKLYQYDSHRIPMRIGLDYCLNGETRAQTYVNRTTEFFANNANAGLNGIGRIFDLYDPTSNNAASSPMPATNSASIIGTAAVGAMASSATHKQPFLNDAYQSVLDTVNRGTMVDPASKSPYSYYNATVGMLTLLIMTGNFSH